VDAYVKFCHVLIEKMTQKSVLVIILSPRADVRAFHEFVLDLCPNLEAEFSSNALFLQVTQECT